MKQRIAPARTHHSMIAAEALMCRLLIFIALLPSIASCADSRLGDIVAGQFFSPKAPTAGGWIMGFGPDGGLRFSVTFLFPKGE